MDPKRLDKRLWPASGLIRSYFPTLNGWYAVGSGTLINRRAILTAAHVVMDRSRGGQPTKFEIFFGNGAATAAPGVNGRVLPEWINSTSTDTSSLDPLSAYDVGVILLAEQNAVAGIQTAGVFSTVLGQVMASETNLVGYPVRSDLYDDLAGDRGLPIDMGPQWNGYRVAYPMVSLGGMSGGPVYRTDESTQRISIRAVNTSIYNGIGNGLMIYPALFERLKVWLAEVT